MEVGGLEVNRSTKMILKGISSLGSKGAQKDLVVQLLKKHKIYI